MSEFVTLEVMEKNNFIYNRTKLTVPLIPLEIGLEKP